ncbi:CHAT domain-containing protein [Streptomyces sp. NPDC059371]|uniref:CHAT domain-containing tetratricopeptide repeat protein n=1 Tax=Streptomyces sp. NPDC059371 TaxID=3346812 RepID=UPI00368BBE84
MGERDAAWGTWLDDRAKANQLNAEASELWKQFHGRGAPALETEAIRSARRAVEHADRSGDSAVRGACRLTLGAMWLERHGRTGDPAELATAERHLVEALALLPPRHGDVPGVHAMIAAARFHRFQRDGDTSALDGAIDAGRLALATAHEDDRRLIGWRSNLGAFLQARFAATDDEADLDEAIELGRAVAGVAQGPQSPLMVGAFLGTLVRRVVRKQDQDDIAEAVSVADRALEMTKPEFPQRWSVLGTVVAAFRAQHQFGTSVESRAALDRAIPLQRELCDTLPDGYPETALHWTSLAELLVLRWNELGGRDDLDEAVRAVRKCDGAARHAALDGQAAATRTLVLMELAKALNAEGDRAGAVHAATESVEAGRSLRSASVGNALLTGRGLMLEANSLLVRHAVAGDPQDLDAASRCFDEAALRCPPDDPQRAILIGNAAQARIGALPDDAPAPVLDPVIGQLREAVDAWNALDARGGTAAQAMANLGAALARRYDVGRDPADLAEAVDLWDGVCRLDAVPPRQRVRVAALAGDGLMAAGDHRGAAERYARAVALLPDAAWRGAGRTGVEAQLTEVRGVACDAAASRLAYDGDAEEALRLLETGRGVLWTRTLQLRQQTTELHRWKPELAASLRDAARALDSLDDPLLTGTQDAEAASRRTDRRAALAREYRRLADEAITSGHGGFLAPPSREEILAAAAHGPVVVVNVSKWRCDALVVTARDIRCRPLPKLSSGETEQRAVDHLAALTALEEARENLAIARAAVSVRPGLPAVRAEHAARRAVAEAARTADTVVDGTVRWLWDAVVADIVEDPAWPLPDDEAAPRLWWCLTGALALLPLHAAGHHDCAAEPRRTLLDRYTCSTTPTVLALARAHRAQAAAPRTADDARMLMVALADAPGQPPLPEVDRERELLCSLLPPERRTVLRGAQADRASVRAALREHPRAHISCHGTQFLDSPSAGGLWLHDGLLTVTDISAGLHEGDFALLSACKTVTGGRGLPDEVISLGAALHFTGYRHVIGTVWSVGARAAADFCETVYTLLIDDNVFDPAGSARAVRQAALGLRDDSSQPRYGWIPFTHTGP